MQLLQNNVCNVIVLRVSTNILLILLLQRYYCYIFVINYCMSKLQCSVSYRYCYLA